MTQHRSDNNNSTAVQAYKDYQAIPEDRDEVMYDFEYWVRNEWSWDEGPVPQTEEHLIMFMQMVIAKYMMEDEKSQALIKAGEQELLEKWSNQ